MELEELLSRLALALGIGLLIGLERGWRTREAAAGSRTAGIRTFAISGLLGGIVAAIAGTLETPMSTAGAIFLTAGFVIHAVVISAYQLAENRADNTFSATTPIAAMLTFALGAYALIGDMWAAAAGGVAVTAVLAVREELHGWIEQLTWPELRSGLVLLAMTCIALPIMPATPVGPLGGVNPREVWLIAIVLAFISFMAYAAVRYLGAQKGVLLAGALGGLVSSTAVTIDSARRAAAHEGSPDLLTASVAMASAVMFLRVIALVAALSPALLLRIAPALVSASVASTACAVFLAYRRRAGDGGGAAKRPASFRNPFSLWAVVGFAAFLAVIMVLSRAVGETLGPTWVMLGAVVAGLADVDAITISLTRLTPAPLGPGNAALAILAAVASDTVSKIGIGAAIGRGQFALQIAEVAAVSLLAGTVAFLLTSTSLAQP